MRSGLAVPINGTYPCDFGPGIKGMSDLFGFTLIDGKPIITFIEVKTHTDTLRPEQKLFLDYMSSVGAEVFIAREDSSADGYRLDKWT